MIIRLHRIVIIVKDLMKGNVLYRFVKYYFCGDGLIGFSSVRFAGSYTPVSTL